MQRMRRAREAGDAACADVGATAGEHARVPNPHSRGEFEQVHAGRRPAFYASLLARVGRSWHARQPRRPRAGLGLAVVAFDWRVVNVVADMLLRFLPHDAISSSANAIARK